MLDNANVDAMVKEVARKHLGRSAVQRTYSESATASDGHEALRITIVVDADAVKKFKGDDVLDTLVQIQNHLLEEGDERFPIIQYATEEELRSGESES